MKNLVIVESPAKAKTIERFLGKEYTVKSSFGHVRDLSKKELGVDIEGGFKPKYEISPDKQKVINELKKAATKAETVWLASDEDREGEAISWHLIEALGIDEKKAKRIVFHEITKTAILDAIKRPRGIDYNLVNAQQARRVLDRLVGFELSPLLWRKVKPSLSAGRVQSVAVRLIVEREEEIRNFKSVGTFRVSATFNVGEDHCCLKASHPQRFKTADDARNFLEKCVGADYQIEAIEKKPATKSPAPPFTTSTLQQEASRKLGFSVAKTMMVAQQLYESGKITYMRTDSVNLSKMALAQARDVIKEAYGDEYVKTRNFTTRSKGAQEAHEAIRPTNLAVDAISGDNFQKRLYDLIWKRTIASQMSPAKLEKTQVTIGLSTVEDKLIASGEQVVFDGFLKVYFESRDDDEKEDNEILPPLRKGMALTLKQMLAEEKFSKAAPRYTEASLVKRMEELGIGRPSTYAPTISTIQKRDYVVKETKKGARRNIKVISLKDDNISVKETSEFFGEEKNKLFPTDIGGLVNKFLVEYFENILDYNFTASVEVEFDAIAAGKRKWNEMLQEFYGPFADQVRDTKEKSERYSGAKELGTDPDSGKPVSVKVGRFGPMVQVGTVEDEEKPRFASLRKGQSIDDITLEQALELLKWPRNLGNHEGDDVMVAIGKYGPYVKYGKMFVSIPSEEDPGSLGLDRAIQLIAEKKASDKQQVILQFGEDEDIKVLNGRYGPYIKTGKKNVKIPKGTDPAKLTLEEVRKLIAEAPEKKTRGRR